MDDRRSPEEQAYWDEHFYIHGHHPIPALDGSGKRCTHPIHGVMQQIMTQPGWVLEFPFDPNEVHTIDDPAVMAYEAGYQEEVARMKDKIKAIEEEAAFDDRDPAHKKRLF